MTVTRSARGPSGLFLSLGMLSLVSARTILHPEQLGQLMVDDIRFELEGEYGKPWLVPYVDVEDAMKDALPSRETTEITPWEAGFLPENCRDYFLREGPPESVKYTVYNVTYDDCDVPWAFCRHDRADVSIEVMADRFGRLPIRMRENVRTIIALPPPPPGDKAVAWSIHGDVAVRPCCWMVKILAHEASHILDSHFLEAVRRKQKESHFRRPQLGTHSSPSSFEDNKNNKGPAAQLSGYGASDSFPLYSQTQRWRDAEKSDQAVATAYSRVNWAEHFAEMVGQGVLEALSPGALGNLSAEAPGKLRNQIDAWVEDWADFVKDRGTCLPAMRPVTPNSVSSF